MDRRFFYAKKQDLYRSAAVKKSLHQHDDSLGIVAEVFAEEVDAAFVFRIVLDADVEFDGSSVVNVQVGKPNFIRNESVIHEHAVMIDSDLFQAVRIAYW